ncbi:MAG: VWA domain-containing protein [Alphaproteobacteria bacterium]|nr:VWA domain-containing protein [Alphaproteobacteria bacterium]
MNVRTLPLTALALLAVALAPRLLPRPAPVEPPPPVVEPISAVPPVAPPMAPPAERGDRPVVDMVFVVDTTGSMGGLLEGAKATIWQILDTVVSQEPRPLVRVGFVAYRDRGDAYVTRTFAPTDDLDAAHAFLTGLQPDGGGDTPESMAAGMQEALDGFQWSGGDRAFRTLFVVADAPDHPYRDQVSARTLAERAAQRGIVVNTVLCGTEASARSDLAALARIGGGAFAAVEQSGGAVAMETPYDERLDVLERRLAENGLAYGNEQGRAYEAKVLGNWASSLSTRASRRSALNKLGAGVASGGGELVGDVLNGKALAEVPEHDLPASYQAMTPAQRDADLQRRLSERRQLQEQVATITAERDAWLAKAREERRKAGSAGFDEAVEAATVGRMRSMGLVR